MAPGRKKLSWFHILRPVVSIGLLFLLLRGTNLTEFLDMAREADFLFLGIALSLVLLAVTAGAYRWQRLLSVQNIRVPLYRLFGLYLVGLFFNNLLPSTIGGDIVRMHEISRYTGKPSASVASVIGERILSAFSLAMTAAVGLILSYRIASRFTGLVVILLAVTLAIILLLAVEKWRTGVGKRIKLPARFSLRKRLDELLVSMGACLQDRWNVALVIVCSMFFHLTQISITYFIFLSLGLHIPFSYFLLFIPIISAIQILPISISGFGLREGAYVYFFGAVGLSSAQAITASLVFWALVTLVSLGGGLIFALRR